MGNDMYEQEDELKKDKETAKTGCGFAVVMIIALIMFLPLLFNLIDGMPSTVDSKSNSGVVVELEALGSPDWPFGSQDGRVWLKLGSFKICSEDFMLSNDGKNMDESNWRVEWKDDRVLITIVGEEQVDEHITLYYDGKTESDSRYVS